MKMTLKDNDFYSDKEAAKIIGVPIDYVSEWRYFGLGGLEGSGKYWTSDYKDVTAGVEFKRALLDLDAPQYLTFRRSSFRLLRFIKTARTVAECLNNITEEDKQYYTEPFWIPVYKYAETLRESFGNLEGFENWRREIANLPTPDELQKRYDELTQTFRGKCSFPRR